MDDLISEQRDRCVSSYAAALTAVLPNELVAGGGGGGWRCVLQRRDVREIYSSDTWEAVQV